MGKRSHSLPMLQSSYVRGQAEVVRQIDLEGSGATALAPEGESHAGAEPELLF